MASIDIHVGDKVHYLPFEGCDPSLVENGRVKSINENMDNHVFVVFNCCDDWDNYQEYTGANTYIEQLGLGWVGKE